MGLGWYVVLERELPDAAISNEGGKALIHHQHELDRLAKELGLTPLSKLVSVRPAAVGAYLQQQGLDPEDFPVPDEEWFEAAEGLSTVRGLLEHLQKQPQAVPNALRVVQDLKGIEKALIVAEREKVSFHLASDLPL